MHLYRAAGSGCLCRSQHHFGYHCYQWDATTGPTFVLVYDSSAPPPPEGIGRPLSFSAVPEAAFNTTVDGLIAADYAIPNLPDGEYLVTALMDVDEDFHPIIADGALSGATCGDWLGAYVSDVLNPEFASVTVQNGQLQDDVTLAIAQEVSVERPAFFLPDTPIMSRSLAGSSPTTPQLFALETTAFTPMLESNSRVHLMEKRSVIQRLPS